MRILQISTADVLGGAEKVALQLHHAFRGEGHDARLAVGRQRCANGTDGIDGAAAAHGANESDGTDGAAAGVVPIRHDAACRGVRRLAWRVHHDLQPWYGRSRLARWACRAAHGVAEPRRADDLRRGLEDFRFPGSWHLADAMTPPPDVIGVHNLHGGYFDLHALPDLTRRAAVFLTLHDAWLTTGHCAHSFDCPRWETGCGQCPDLTTYPAVRRDATDENWRRKRDILSRGRFYVATPCHWLMHRVRRSLLAPSIIESRVIPYGVDLAVYHPGDRAAARAAMGLPAEAFVLVFAANGIRNNAFKDFRTMRAALDVLAREIDGPPIIFLAMGQSGSTESWGRAKLVWLPFDPDPAQVARTLQAADVYVHAARADTFPNAVLEALACGLPVVATAVGGIPEQVRSWSLEPNCDRQGAIQERHEGTKARRHEGKGSGIGDQGLGDPSSDMPNYDRQEVLGGSPLRGETPSHYREGVLPRERLCPLGEYASVRGSLNEKQTAARNSHGPSPTDQPPTGILTPPGDAPALARAIGRLMNDAGLRHCLGESAARDARTRFDLRRQAADYLAWFAEVTITCNGRSSA